MTLPSQWFKNYPVRKKYSWVITLNSSVSSRLLKSKGLHSISISMFSNIEKFKDKLWIDIHMRRWSSNWQRNGIRPINRESKIIKPSTSWRISCKNKARNWKISESTPRTRYRPSIKRLSSSSISTGGTINSWKRRIRHWSGKYSSYEQKSRLSKGHHNSHPTILQKSSSWGTDMKQR